MFEYSSWEDPILETILVLSNVLKHSSLFHVDTSLFFILYYLIPEESGVNRRNVYHNNTFYSRKSFVSGVAVEEYNEDRYFEETLKDLQKLVAQHGFN